MLIDCHTHRSQVVVNLVSNALKYTDQGYVRLACCTVEQGSKVAITLEDTGTGVAPEEMEKVWGRFVQAEGSRDGSGIGLQFCKAMVENMGGTIGFDPLYKDPIRGKGTRVVIKLHLLKSDQPQSQLIVQPLQQQVTGGDTEGCDGRINDDGVVALPTHLRVLLVDDCEFGLSVLQRRLCLLAGGGGAGWKFEHAGSGEVALQLAKERHYELMIIDERLPDGGGCMRGHEVMRQMRGAGVTSVIIGHSGNDMRALHLQEGANAFWRKPEDSAVMRADLMKWLALPAAAPPQSAAPLPVDGPDNGIKKRALWKGEVEQRKGLRTQRLSRPSCPLLADAMI